MPSLSGGRSRGKEATGGCRNGKRRQLHLEKKSCRARTKKIGMDAAHIHPRQRRDWIVKRKTVVRVKRGEALSSA